LRRVIREAEEGRSGGFSKALALAFAILIAWVALSTVANPPAAYVKQSAVYLVDPPSISSCSRTWTFGRHTICKTLPSQPIPVGTKYWEPATAFVPILSYGSEPGSPDVNFKPHGRGSYTGQGVVVAVVDTGIDYTHPAFEGAIIEMWSVIYRSGDSGEFLHWIFGGNGSLTDLLTLDRGLRAIHGEYAFMDENGHGTHVAGIIAGRPVDGFVGFAPSAKLFIVKAFIKNGTASLDMVLDGLKIVYDNVERLGIRVVNLSWGALLNSDGSDPISVAAGEIARKGVLVFAAAGNEGNMPFKILSPAVHPDVIAIGAVDPETGAIAPFSSWGTTVDLRMKPDFVAAGVSILSARSNASNLNPWRGDPRLTYLSGTSMATAVASGIGAQYAEYWMMFEAPSGRGLVESFLRFQEAMVTRYNPHYKDFISGLGVLRAI
jgi:subtilisin family serine protease